MKMINDYSIEVKEFAKEESKFCVSFDYRWVEALDDRKITTCCIIELPSKKIYAGATIKNHKDNSNDWLARRWAYKRAVLMIYLIWTQTARTSISFVQFWQYFRKALAENEIYLKERKNKYG
jgi:hypothetical protein